MHGRELETSCLRTLLPSVRHRKTFQSACRLAMDRSCKELICVPAVNLPLSPPLSPYLLQQQQELSGRQEITSMKRVLLADFFLCDSGCTHRGRSEERRVG